MNDKLRKLLNHRFQFLFMVSFWLSGETMFFSALTSNQNLIPPASLFMLIGIICLPLRDLFDKKS